MLLNIELIQGKDMFCYESAVASLAAYLKRRYEMIYIDAWRLDFLKGSGHESCHLGKRISSGYRNKWNIGKNFEKYHGIRINWNKPDGNTFSLLKEQLEKGLPTLTLFDSFYSPWAPESEKEAHFFTFFLVIGFDECTKNVHCVDFHCLKRAELLHAENFEKGYDSCYTFLPVGEENKSFDINAVLKDSIMEMTSNGARPNSFDHIREISETIRSSYNIFEEYEGKQNPLDVEIIKNIEGIARSRYLYSDALRYMHSLCGPEDLLSVSDSFVEISNKWHLIKYLMVKSFRQKKADMLFYEKIANQVSNLADFEENTAEAIRKIADGSPLKAVSRLNSVKKSDIMTDVKEAVFVKLDQYVNNKGFCSKANYNNADLSGTGQFILRNETADRQVLKLTNAVFDIGLIKTDGPDNISCMGQVIGTPEGCFKTIALLGCSVWGSFSGKMTIVYMDDETEELTIGFTNWSTDIPAFDEMPAWEGSAALIGNKGIEPLDFKVCLFAKEYCLKHQKAIKCIRLPDYINLHLFGLTLYK